MTQSELTYDGPTVDPFPAKERAPATCVSVFVDGGVITRNPSAIGGTFAYVLVDQHGEEIANTSGVILPFSIGLPVVSNNVSELVAAVEAMAIMPDGWDGVLHTDSYVTLCRITTSYKFNGVPKDLMNRCLRERSKAADEGRALGRAPEPQRVGCRRPQGRLARE